MVLYEKLLKSQIKVDGKSFFLLKILLQLIECDQNKSIILESKNITAYRLNYSIYVSFKDACQLLDTLPLLRGKLISEMWFCKNNNQ